MLVVDTITESFNVHVFAVGKVASLSVPQYKRNFCAADVCAFLTFIITESDVPITRGEINDAPFAAIYAYDDDFVTLEMVQSFKVSPL